MEGGIKRKASVLKEGNPGLLGADEMRYDKAIDRFCLLCSLTGNWQLERRYESVGANKQTEQVYESEGVGTTTNYTPLYIYKTSQNLVILLT